MNPIDLKRLDEIRNRLALSSPDMRLGTESDRGAYSVATCGMLIGRMFITRSDLDLVICCGKPSINGPYPYYDQPQAVNDALFLANAQRDIAFLMETIEGMAAVLRGNACFPPEDADASR